jgi:hypothetical protein
MDSLKAFSGKNVLTSFILFMASYILIGSGWVGSAGVAAASGGARIPDMLFAYGPAELAGIFEALGPGGRAAYLSMNAIDFFFAGAYGAFYFLAIGWSAARLFPGTRALRFLGVIGVLGALCDEAENVVFRLAASGSSIDGPASSIAAAATTAKFCLDSTAMALAAIGLAATAVAAALEARRRSTRNR